MGNIRVHLVIEGRVQGVWFRDSTRTEAIALGVFGWVKNQPDATVAVLAEGPETQVRKLVSWCHHGPPAAQVSRVSETKQEWKGEYKKFDIIL